MSTSDTAPLPDKEPSAEELADLRAEVKFLREQVAQQEVATKQAANKPPSTWWRTALSIVLIVVACALAPLSVFSVWVKGEVTNTERYVATVAPLASNPAVQAAVTTRITDEIFKYIDVNAITADLVDTISANRNLDPRKQAALQALAGPVTSGIKSFTESSINKIVTSQAFQTAWTQANYVAHTQIVNALSGQDNGAVSVANNEVTLDLGDVITQVKQQLVAQGFTIAEKIPVVDTQIVLFQSDNIGKLQTAYSALDALGFWLPILTFVIGIAGVLAAKGRRRAFIGLGIGVFISMGIIALALNIGRGIYLNDLPPTVSRDAAAAVYDAFALYLQDGIRSGVILGIVLILGGIFTGPSRLAVGVRGLAKKGAALCQRGLYNVGATMNSARAFVAAQVTAIRLVVVLLAVAFVLIQTYKTPDLIIWTTVVLLVLLFIIQIFASGATDKSGEDDAEDSSDDQDAQSADSKETVSAT